MKQYLDLLKEIQNNGTDKPAARPNMPGSRSLFGYQFRHNLLHGFPILTTKEVWWRGVVTELLWFLRGDTNIKYLLEHGVNIWNEDAYSYYQKKMAELRLNRDILSFTNFIQAVKQGWWTVQGTEDGASYPMPQNYTYGDCGQQYGAVWRNFGYIPMDHDSIGVPIAGYTGADQIARLIKSLQETPESRRHLVSAIDPRQDNDLALYWCHAMFQFNCRPLTLSERLDVYNKIPRDQKSSLSSSKFGGEESEVHSDLDDQNIPKYFLDCQLYQRSADVVLGVPFNIASYALLTYILAKICNMVPGEFIHTFGDVHIYDNHQDAVKEQLTREPGELPTLEFSEDFKFDFIWDINNWTHFMFKLVDYKPQGKIYAELSTGVIK